MVLDEYIVGDSAADIGPVDLTIVEECWPRCEPFRIAGHVFETVDCVLVILEARNAIGRGEGGGVYYMNETPRSMSLQLEQVRPQIEQGLTRSKIQKLLPPGGARNALDCAFWDLEARLSGVPVWMRAGLPKPRPLITTFTCGADTPERMAEAALSFKDARAIKLKLVGDGDDCARISAVRRVLPEVWLSIDANQGFTLDGLRELMPAIEAARVKLIEQPFAIGNDALLDNIRSAIPFAADESVQAAEDIPSLVGRYDVVNIKLDKAGGFTEALAMARLARAHGLDVMVGCMGGTSLAMAPGCLIGLLCDIVDLDQPAFLSRDRSARVEYHGGMISAPAMLWGGAEPPASR